MKSPIITASPMIAFAFASAAQGAVVPSSPLLTRNANTQSISRRAEKAAASTVDTADAYLSYAPMRRTLNQATVDSADIYLSYGPENPGQVQSRAEKAASVDSADIYLSYGPEEPGQVQSRGSGQSSYSTRGSTDEQFTSYQPPPSATKRRGLTDEQFTSYQPPPADATKRRGLTDEQFTSYQKPDGFTDVFFSSYPPPTDPTERRGVKDEQFVAYQETTKRRGFTDEQFTSYQPPPMPVTKRATVTADSADAYLRYLEARRRDDLFARLEAEADGALEEDVVDPDDKYLIGFLLHKLNR